MNGFAATASVSASGLTPATMGLTPAAFTPTTPVVPGENNPHEPLAALLSWRLNELVGRGKEVAASFVGVSRVVIPC
jgi:hypothetical protein